MRRSYENERHMRNYATAGLLDS